jgi:hypothetical protein
MHSLCIVLCPRRRHRGAGFGNPMERWDDAQLAGPFSRFVTQSQNSDGSDRSEKRKMKEKEGRNRKLLFTEK